MAGANVKELNNQNFESEIDSDIPVLVDFWAPWCGPCRMLGPIVEEIADETVGKYKVCKINVDENGEIAAKFRVMSIPTVYVFKKGQAVDNVVGVRTKDELLKMLEKHA